MAGVKVTKNYVSANINNNNVANNWMVLVFGVTSRGPTKPTLIQNYDLFTATYGEPVSGAPTHAYMRFLLENGVAVLFKRVIDSTQLKAANLTIKNASVLDVGEKNLFSVTATDAYIGKIGNSVSIAVEKNNITKAVTFQIKLNNKLVENFGLGQDIDDQSIGTLVYNFINQAVKSTSNVSNYVTFNMIELDSQYWTTDVFPIAETALTGGSEPNNDKSTALALLADKYAEIYKDTKLLHSITYYPQLRFCTTGGLVDSNTTNNETIFENLGEFATNSKTSFRVLVDYSVEMTDISTVRNFARAVAAKNSISTSVYAYVGFWGADNNNNFLPGSAGFLTGISRAGYNVYSRRIAGTGVRPAFAKPYKEVYIDALNDWQGEDTIQVNPIMIIDAQDNNAVMGSSTLAMPLSTLNTRNPAQALDICCVGDYIAAILNGIALNELEAALDRLSLSALSNRMVQELERFVTSGAITRYDLNFDTTQLGKLGVECVLYFAIGLEEVSITVTSMYDTDLVQ